MNQRKDSEIININVRGRLFSTTLATLRQQPSSLLGQIANGLLPPIFDKAGNLFFDFDFEAFSLLLNFLRDGEIDIPSSASLRKKFLKACDNFQVKITFDPSDPSDPDTSFYPSSPPSPPDSPPDSPCSSPPSSPSSSRSSSPDFQDSLSQISLYTQKKTFLYNKYQQLWETVKETIKREFLLQAQSLSSSSSFTSHFSSHSKNYLSCRFPLISELVSITPFLVKELQEEGLTDLQFHFDYQTGVTFFLDLEKISSDSLSDFQAEQEGRSSSLLRSSRFPSASCF